MEDTLEGSIESEQQRYAVASFPDDDTVEVVSSNWTKGDICYWPPYRTSSSKFRKALEKHEHPDSEWIQYPTRVLQYYDDFSTATKKCKKAEETSALDTQDSEEERRRSRDKRRKMLNPHMVDDINADDCFRNDKRSVRPKHKSTSCQSTCQLPPVPQDLQQLSLSSIHAEDIGTHVASCAVILSPTLASTSDASYCMQRASTTVSSTPLRATNGTGLHNSYGSVSDVFVTKIAMLETTQCQQTQLLRAILEAVKADKADDLPSELPAEISLPMTSLENLRNVEHVINTSNDGLRKLTRYLGLIGGHNKYDVTRRIMRALMTNDLARKLNFAGRGNKQGIKDLKILSVIIDAVRRNQELRNCSSQKICDTIKNWLKTACDRDGDRRKRMKSNDFSVTETPSDNSSDSD